MGNLCFICKILTNSKAYASTGIVTLYHDLIVLKYLQSVLKPTDGTEKLVGHNNSEEENATNTRSILPPQWCTRIAKFIAIIQHTELIIEIYAKQKWGKRGKWTAIAFIEIVK